MSATEDQSGEVEVRPSLSTATAKAPKVISKGGLTTDEARRRLARSGPNAMSDTSANPIRMALDKFWAPVPWMLEAAIVVELALGKYVEAGVIALLLVFNAVLGTLPGKSRSGDACCAEVAACANRLRPARRRLKTVPQKRWCLAMWCRPRRGRFRPNAARLARALSRRKRRVGRAGDEGRV